VGETHSRELRDASRIYALHNGSQAGLLRRNINLYAVSDRLPFANLP